MKQRRYSQRTWCPWKQLRYASRATCSLEKGFRLPISSIDQACFYMYCNAGALLTIRNGDFSAGTPQREGMRSLARDYRNISLRPRVSSCGAPQGATKSDINYLICEGIGPLISQSFRLVDSPLFLPYHSAIPLNPHMPHGIKYIAGDSLGRSNGLPLQNPRKAW